MLIMFPKYDKKISNACLLCTYTSTVCGAVRVKRPEAKNHPTVLPNTARKKPRMNAFPSDRYQFKTFPKISMLGLRQYKFKKSKVSELCFEIFNRIIRWYYCAVRMRK